MNKDESGLGQGQTAGKVLLDVQGEGEPEAQPPDDRGGVTNQTPKKDGGSRRG